ncbi:MAG: phosphoribosylformylglycinamidine cyclo-ligase, partial [Methanobacterium sp.]|nr:phosphoribosylformylglycinamidine cyclo-ligase [Methanobacterium sp.]
SGIHSNGLSLARRVFFEDSGLDVNDPLPGYPERTVGEELLMPTAIYVEPIMERLRSDVVVHGLAHITGGGFTNLKRLKKGTGYKIDYLPEPHPIFKSIYSFNVPLEEMYRVFNMGIGFVVILKGEDVDEALDIIRKYEKAHLIGQVMGDIEEKIEIHTFENKTLLL